MDDQDIVAKSKTCSLTQPAICRPDTSVASFSRAFLGALPAQKKSCLQIFRAKKSVHDLARVLKLVKLKDHP